MIFEDIANVMNARPVKEIMRKTGLTKNRVYSLRMGCTFHMDYELLFALQRMGYEVRVVGRGATLERSESGVGQHIGPGGAAGAFSPEEALPGMELAGGGVPGGLPGAGMPVQGGAGNFPGMGPAMA